MKEKAHSGRSCMTLFPPWKPDSWIGVDDSVRGGASKSYLEHWNGTKDNDVAIFRGHLDTTVLGGAGFASQKIQYSRPLDLRYGSNKDIRAGLRLSIRPQDRVTGMPSHFVITLKTQPPIPPVQPKARSQLIYEAMFVAPLPSYDLSMDGEKNPVVTPKHKVASIVLPFNSFTPTFRGRTVPPDSPQWKEMDLSQVYELGIMCRSEFGKQQGDFEIVLEKIEVVTMESSPAWHWKQFRVSGAIATFGQLEGMLWRKFTDLLCCNVPPQDRKEDGIAKR